jgi:hypothetical protein
MSTLKLAMKNYHQNPLKTTSLLRTRCLLGHRALGAHAREISHNLDKLLPSPSVVK